MRITRAPAVDQLLAAGVDFATAPVDSVGDDWVDHEILIALAKQRNMPLSDALRGCGVWFAPPAPQPAKPKEYEELMARLRVEEGERQYQALLRESQSAGPAVSSSLSSSELKEVKEQLTTILNIMVSVAAIAWAFWHWTASWDLGARTLISLFAGIGIGVAETVVYLGYKRRVSEARASERAAREQRTVVKKIVFDRGTEKVIDVPVPPSDSVKEGGLEGSSSVPAGSESDLRQRHLKR